MMIRSRPIAQGVLVAVSSLALGMATSWAQGWLPDAFESFANSVSGWTVCTALLVAAARPGLRWAAVLGPTSFVALVVGYAAASYLRGLVYDPTLWGALGLLAGPFVGAASAAVVGAGPRIARACGGGVLGGLLAADGIRGLTVVADSTSPVYWTVVLVLASLLLCAVAVRLRDARLVLIELATAVVTGGLLVLGLAMLVLGGPAL